MKKTDLDKVICRRGTGCTKFDAIEQEIGDRPDVLPMWIADMDFATPDFVLNALRKRMEHPILGYSYPTKAYYEALQNWFEKRYGFRPAAEELCFTPGIVAGIYKLVACLTHEGDGIVLCPPVYHPFGQVIRGSKRKMVEAPLILEGERYEIDFEALDKALSQAKLLIWCHPHNPGGRVWTPDELKKVASLATKHNVIVISDEIHADLTYAGHKHTPFPAVSDDAAQCSISLMAPSKAFNMPGIIASQIYIKNPELRKKVFDYLELNCLNHANATTYGAVAAAYNEGEEWLGTVMEYIQENVEFVRHYLQENIPCVKMIEPEASFLIFLDCRELNLKSDKEMDDFFINRAHLLLNNGSMFGTGGQGFMRLNVGVPRSVLEDAMNRLRDAVKEHQSR